MSTPPNSTPHQGFSNNYTLWFTLTLCSICAVVLAALASGLQLEQTRAIELDRSKQMLIAAHIMTHEGVLQVQTAPGVWEKAQLNDRGRLQPDAKATAPTAAIIRTLFEARIKPMFTNSEGKLSSPKEHGISVDRFFAEHQKLGFAHLEYKLLYVILEEGEVDPIHGRVMGYIIPVNGFGLWGPIYGYIAIDRDAKTVLGISWYQHAETPGLGANIAESAWQKQFFGKNIFQKDRSGLVNYQLSPLGIVVIKGKVTEVYGGDPRAQSSVDGMTGATITGNGVSRAYQDVLEQYRPFLIAVMKDHP